MTKVSVIIPVYHAEKYIRECMDSLLGQTLKEIEIICVLDCPKDQTGNILKEIAQEDSRIRVIENAENMGAALSRNRGLEYAAAPYTMFLDADDVFEPDMLEAVCGRLDETGADLCLFEFDTFYDGEDWKAPADARESGYADVFTIADLPEDGLYWTGVATCNRIYRTSFLKENKLSFQNLKTGNDNYIGIMSLLLAEKIAHTKTDKIYWHYRLGIPGQITARANPMDTCMAYQKVHEELEGRGQWEQYKRYFFIRFLMSITREIAMGRNEDNNQRAYQWIQKEGVSQFGMADIREEDFNDPCYALELRKFAERDYESGWFRYAVKLQMQLDYYKENITRSCSAWLKEGKGLSVWGAGQYGGTILHFFDENHIPCDIVIDIDEKKRGSTIENRRIYVFDEVSSLTGVIIVANKRYAGQVREMVARQRKEIRVVTVDEMTGRSDVP